MNLFVFLQVLSFASYVCCQSASCNSHRSCGACISHVSARCVWCAEDKKNATESRCQPESLKNNEDWCKKIYIHQPTDEINIQPNDEGQFHPQEIKITASPGVEVKFNVTYKPALDFPLDVYFVLDYSYTMKTYKEELKKQALEIYAGLTKMTGNVLLGVGSFVEKPTLPYADPLKADSYAFKNHLKLTDNMTEFQNVINKSRFGSNYDDAEAGLDALMQVMACDKKLGWRTDTRRIIVLATDNTYHSAGDGKMLGAIKPNDKTCHLEDDEYKPEYSLNYDYPSVGLINEVAREGKYLIIFAARQNMKTVYEALSSQIAGSKYAELKENSNILEFIKKAYEESVNEVKIDWTPSPSAIDSFAVNIDQVCKGTKKNCVSTPTYPIVTIPVTIKSLKCPTSDEDQIITMNPTGLNEKLTVKFRVDCNCKCENGPSGEKDTPDCNKRGFKQCGACKCNKDWGGDTCEVNCSDETSMVLEKKCYPTNSTRKCNGHGTCECGTCACSDGFTGDVCEFDPTSCDTGNNGKICAGADHGACKYGACDCRRGWTGKACDCPVEEKSKKKCTGPFSKTPCSGRGNCDCGKCICNKVSETDETYSGVFCDNCKECAAERCEELKDYAICNFNEEKSVCDSKFNLTTEMNLDVVVANKSELVVKDEWKIGTQCRTPLPDETILIFKYNVFTNPSFTEESDTKLLLMIQKEVEIPPKADLIVPIAAAIAGILLIGLLTVVFWKVLIELYDKREYNKFCSQAKSQGYDVGCNNPLYEPPTMTVDNPAFNRD